MRGVHKLQATSNATSDAVFPSDSVVRVARHKPLLKFAAIAQRAVRERMHLDVIRKDGAPAQRVGAPKPAIQISKTIEPLPRWQPLAPEHRRKDPGVHLPKARETVSRRLRAAVILL